MSSDIYYNCLLQLPRSKSRHTKVSNNRISEKCLIMWLTSVSLICRVHMIPCRCITLRIFFKILKMFIFTWKIRNVLKRMKNQFSDFCDFYFLRYGRFCSQNRPIFYEFWVQIDHNSKTKNRRIDFSFLPAHCARFLKIWPLLSVLFFGRRHTWKVDVSL